MAFGRITSGLREISGGSLGDPNGTPSPRIPKNNSTALGGDGVSGGVGLLAIPSEARPRLLRRFGWGMLMDSYLEGLGSSILVGGWLIVIGRDSGGEGEGDGSSSRDFQLTSPLALAFGGKRTV